MHKKIERQKAIEKELRSEFVTIKSNRKYYDEYVEFGKIYNHINKSNRKLTEEQLKNL